MSNKTNTPAIDTNVCACAPCNLYIVRYTYGYTYEGTTNSDKYYGDEHTAMKSFIEEINRVQELLKEPFRDEIVRVTLLHNNEIMCKIDF